MVKFFDVRVKGFDKVASYFQNLKVSIPKAVTKDLRVMSMDMKKGLTHSLKAQGLVWRGLLQEEVAVRKVSKTQWDVLIPNYGRYMDSMEPHRVVVKGKPLLEQWAEEHFNEVPYSMTVKPHPWIREGLREGGKRATNRLRTGEIVRVFRGGKIA